MSIFATINEDGFVTGFYYPDQEAPEGSVEIDHETYLHVLEYPQTRRYDGSAWVDYSPPPPTHEQLLASMSPVSHAQIIAALIMSDIITEAEGVAWISGTLPDAVEAMIAGLPADRRIIARLRAIRPTSVIPSDPLVAALAAAQGKGAQDMVDLFTLAASL